MRPLYVLCSLGLSLRLAALACAAEPASISTAIPISTEADGVHLTTVVLERYYYQPYHLIVKKSKAVELTLKIINTITPHNIIIKDPAGSHSVVQDVSAGKTAV